MIETKEWLSGLGYAQKEIEALPEGTLAEWKKIINGQPIDQEAVKRWLLANIFIMTQKVSEPPKTFWQTFLDFFRRDPQQSILKARLGVYTELYALMDYDPHEQLKKLKEELIGRLQN